MGGEKLLMPPLAGRLKAIQMPRALRQLPKQHGALHLSYVSYVLFLLCRSPHQARHHAHAPKQARNAKRANAAHQRPGWPIPNAPVYASCPVPCCLRSHADARARLAACPAPACNQDTMPPLARPCLALPATTRGVAARSKLSRSTPATLRAAPVPSARSASWPGHRLRLLPAR